MTNPSLSSRAARGWTDERRARHSAAIRRWAPWTKSAGPRTAEGKHISSLNALKHGAYSRPVKQFFRQLRAHTAFCRYISQQSISFWRNELLKKRRLGQLKRMFKSTFNRMSNGQPPPIRRSNRKTQRSLLVKYLPRMKWV